MKPLVARRFVVGLVVLVGVVLGARRAHADKKRRVAVFEYRAGSRAAPEVAERLAESLRKASNFDVIDPAEGRRREGAGMDAEIARCAGDARCIATIAQRMQADEALLVGVSQLGDVVIALQRIDVQHGNATSRLAESLPAGEQPDDHALSDWLHQLYPADAFSRFGALRIVSDADDATVTIDGTKRGQTPLPDALNLAAPGSYRVRVDKPGYVPFQVRIDVVPDTSIEVHATLSRSMVAAPWYKRGYVWGTVGGVIAAAGIGVAIYYGTRVDHTPHGYIIPPTP